MNEKNVEEQNENQELLINTDGTADGDSETSPEKQEIIDGAMNVIDVPIPLKMNDHFYRIAGYLVVLICFFGMGTWAAFAPLDSAVVAMGQVREEGNSKTVQHLEGGIIEDILIADGDYVEKGQVLVRLNDTNVRTQFETTRLQYLTHLAQFSRFLAERDNKAEIEFSDGLDSSDPVVHKMLEAEKRLFAFRKESLKEQIQVLNQRIAQLNVQISGLQQMLVLQKERIAAFTDDIKEWQVLYEKQMADKQQLRQIKQQKMSLESELAGQQSEIARLKIRIGETESEIILLRREFMKDVELNIRETQLALGDYRIKLAALSEMVDRTLIKAPASGIVAGMDFHTVGGVIPPGKTLFTIVPQTKEFVIDIMIPLGDIDKMASGLPVDIRFSAFADRSREVIAGEVVWVAADSTEEPRSGARYYKGTVEVISEGHDKMREEDIEIMSGMPAEVIVKTGARTVLDYILKPFSDMIARSFREE